MISWRLGLIVLLGCGAAVAVGETALGGVSTSADPTTVIVDHIAVSPDGALQASGRVVSDRRLCRLFRLVQLRQVMPDRDLVLDSGFSSIPGGEWGVRVGAGVPPSATLYVKVQREVVKWAKRVHGHRRVHRRVCEPARVALDSAQGAD
jgi:hypothetical protein